MRLISFCFIGLLISASTARGQDRFSNRLNDIDSATQSLPDKVSHAEPLYVDLMRDLGARKGEKEINAGFGMGEHKNYKDYVGFVEYEWAPLNRLGLEIQADYSFPHAKPSARGLGLTPAGAIESIQLAGQYTFLVDKAHQTSMAVGYIHQFKLNSLSAWRQDKRGITGMAMTPILIAATKVGQLNMLLYSGPVFDDNFIQKSTTFGGTINTSFLYVLPDQKNFIGFENNMDFDEREFHYFIRPQMKLTLAEDLAIGFVVGFPITGQEDLSTDFTTRIIWEP